MEGVGQFSKTLVCLGTLAGANLANGVQFKYYPDDGNSTYEAMVYTGNRVNLYVHNYIRSNQQVSPNSFGLQIGWSFTSRSQGNPSVPPWIIRNLDMGGLPAPPIQSPLSAVMEDAKIEYAVDGSGDMGVQYGELGHNAYLFPKYGLALPGSLRLWHIIPLTARADFINVYFWCNPLNWVGGGVEPIVDRVTVYALVGSDVAGSQRIGGGHG